jgi:hypothetical protein
MDSKYSICCIYQCLEEVGKVGLKIFSCLDMRNRFLNQVLRETDRHYTAFTIPGIGQLQWTVTVQGLCGGPAAFSILMDTFMVGASNVITYVDDVLIHSATHEAHIAHLRHAIQLTHKAGLELNPKKCIFGSTTVEYLGHTISLDGVRPGKDKTQAMKDITESKTMKQLKSFIGQANYFRSYVKGFARVASDLNALTRQNTKWKEKDGLPKRSKEAFEAIKAAISSRPVMAYPNNNGRFQLFVDAALSDSKDEEGLGAALWQEDEHGIKQVIGYASRRLTTSEKNYPAFVAEMQAAVYRMTYFQHYLVTRKFTLYTDHKPLCKLRSTQSKILNRFQLKMTELSPEIRYIEGKNNTVTDFLNRYHGLGAEDKKTETREYSSKHQGLGVAQGDASAPRIRALQLLDNNLEPMIRHDPNAKECRIVEDQLKPTNLKRQILHVQNRIVYITNQIRPGYIDDPDNYALKEGMPGPTTHKILAPQGFRKEIITEAHNSKFAGHGGRFKTQERLRQDFWWPHMDKDIKEHIDQCEPCQTKTDKGKPPDGPITGLQIPSGPSQRIHADLFGPLQNSERGNMYILVITDAFTKMARLTPGRM